MSVPPPNSHKFFPYISRWPGQSLGVVFVVLSHVLGIWVK